LFTVAVSTGFLSTSFVQRAQAFSIDFSGLPGIGDNQGLNFLQGPKGDKGDTGAQGPAGEPFPHQSTLFEHAERNSNGETLDGPSQIFTPEGSGLVCVP
jgi:hypothetical protein